MRGRKKGIKMKIAWFKKNISPEIGAFIAGYSLNDKSVAKLDDLYACGMCADDGTNKILLISLDLIGLDGWYIRKIRKACADILHIPEHAVMLSCTHTHTGPESRSIAGHPEKVHTAYLEKLETTLIDAVAGLTVFRECEVSFYSCKCDENRNRRYVSGDNRATFTPHRREVLPGATEFADQELGAIYFCDAATKLPVYAIGNYAAHPLAGHAPGLGGLRISADYPGAFRNYVTSNTGAETMFVSGAAGDLVPKEDELGEDSMRGMGVRLGKEFIGGMIESRRNPRRYGLPDVKVGSCIKPFKVRLRKHYANQAERMPEEYLGSDDVTLEIQCISIGDVCFVGVPGELCCELGQEIKWHSPFRRTFIAYSATAYICYIVPANFLVSGGYEPICQCFTAKGGLTLLNTAVDAMFDLHETIYPSEGEPYPDGCFGGVVNILPNR